MSWEGEEKVGHLKCIWTCWQEKKALMKKKLVQMRMERAFSGWNIQKLKLRKGKQISDFFDNCQISCEFYHTFVAIEIKISLYGVIIKLTE